MSGAIPVQEGLPTQAETAIDLTLKMNPEEGLPFDETSLGLSLQTVVQGLAKGVVPEDQLALLRPLIPPPGNDVAYDASFNIRNEIEEQLRICKGLKEEVFDLNGKIRPKYDLRDAKYVISAVNDIIDTLMKKSETLVNFERVQKIETAVKEAIDRLPEASKQQFLVTLEEHLSE